MKKIFLLLLSAGWFGTGVMAREVEVSWFAPKSFYFYTLASWNFQVPLFADDYHILRTTAGHSRDYGYSGRNDDSELTPALGVGYSFFNFADRLRLDGEFEYSRAHFADIADGGATFHYYSVLLNAVYRPVRDSRFEFFAGAGFSAVDIRGRDLPAYTDYSRAPLVSSLGLRFRLTRNVSLRAEYRHFWDTYGYNLGYGYDYYWENDWLDYGSRLGAGLEFRF